jgi:proteasome lid subunit RPN8/RPN11
MSDPSFASWSVAESPITIEYTLVVLEEIRRAVTEGFQRLSRGGLEVGGVLYGTRENRTVRVLALREIDCEHARGPSFLLSEKDRGALAEQLVQDLEDPRLEGMTCVGWFLSHTRGEIALTESDLEIYSTFFPAPWQVTLVIRPGRGSSMRAGFFVREADGTVKTGHSYLDFNFPDRLAGVLDAASLRDRRPGAERRRFPFSREEAGAEPSLAPSRRHFSPALEPSPSGPRLLPSPPPTRKWGWLAAWLLLAIGLVVFGLRYFTPRSYEPVSLSVIERDGQLQIEWNHTARPVTGAARGSLEIIDGKDTRTVALTPQDLASGRFTYVRNTGDIDVRMTVIDRSGSRVQEMSRFLGPPPVKVNAGEVEAIKQSRDEMEAEVARLRQQNGAQAARIQQLERTLRILQTRMGSDQGKK